LHSTIIQCSLKQSPNDVYSSDQFALDRSW
jgi:hypothetical protein